MTSEICIDLVRSHYLEVLEFADFDLDFEDYFSFDCSLVLVRCASWIEVLEIDFCVKGVLRKSSAWYNLFDEILGSHDFKLYFHESGIMPSANDRVVVPMDLPFITDLESVLVSGAGLMNFTLYGRKDSERFVLSLNEPTNSRQGIEKDVVVVVGDVLYNFVNFLADKVNSVKKLYLYQVCFGDGLTLDRIQVNSDRFSRFMVNYIKHKPKRKVKSPKRRKKT